jgi:hypothetical protein
MPALETVIRMVDKRPPVRGLQDYRFGTVNRTQAATAAGALLDGGHGVSPSIMGRLLSALCPNRSSTNRTNHIIPKYINVFSANTK